MICNFCRYEIKGDRYNDIKQSVYLHLDCLQLRTLIIEDTNFRLRVKEMIQELDKEDKSDRPYFVSVKKIEPIDKDFIKKYKLKLSKKQIKSIVQEET